MKKLYCDENLVAGMSRLEEHDGLEIVTKGYPTAVEVDDLRHRPVGVRPEAEPDTGAGKVIAVECARNFNNSAVPDGILGGGGGRRNEWP